MKANDRANFGNPSPLDYLMGARYIFNAAYGPEDALKKAIPGCKPWSLIRSLSVSRINSRVIFFSSETLSLNQSEGSHFESGVVRKAATSSATRGSTT